MTTIDLNCDMGEIWDLQQNGTQAALLRYVSSVNIACGAHAGDERLIQVTIDEALNAGVAIGAHPGYPDRANFGRVRLALSARELTERLLEQLEFFGRIADGCGAEIVHVKPHGALYNVAALDEETASAIAAAVGIWKSDVVLVGLAGSRMLQVFAAAGFPAFAEAFADRRYAPDGTLCARNVAGAVLTDPDAAAAQAVDIVRNRAVVAVDGSSVPINAQTLCIHSDTAGAVQMAARVRGTLQQAGIPVAQPV